MRWALAAHDICYTKKLNSLFFTFGKSIPVVRRDGVYQPAIDFAVNILNQGHWLHLYPEGRVNLTKDEMRLKWGVGRLVAECKKVPIVIPIYHVGMDSILPNKKPYYPRIMQKVTIVVGPPINVQDTLDELKTTDASALDMRLALTNLIQKQLYKLKITAEIYHMYHLAGVRQ